MKVPKAVVYIAPIVSVMLFVSHVLVPNLPFAETVLFPEDVPGGDLTELQKAKLGLFTHKNGTLVTLSTFLIGGLGALITAIWSQGKILPLAARWSGYWAFLFSVASIYFGYVANQGVLWMMGKRVFNLQMSRIVVPDLLQFYFFLVATIAFFIFSARLVKEGGK